MKIESVLHNDKHLLAQEQTKRFTGQKQDGTGLLYYNARYYDPALGTFLSPDTLVPDGGRVIDYNRFLYVRGNPLSYSDPSGHCATTTNGQPDMDGDTECWQIAYGIAGLGYTEQGFWDDWGGQNRSEWWLNNIANQSFADLGYLTPFYERYQSEFESRTGLRQPVSLEPVPPQPELWSPGSQLLKPVLRDIGQCSADFPWGCATAADDAALAVASTGVLICASATGGTCLGVTGLASTVFGGVGATITTKNAFDSEFAWINVLDVMVSWGTTLIGGAYGGELEGIVGATLSLGQRMYDEWSIRR